MLLEVKNLEKTYYSGKVDFKALKNINLGINKGEFTALVGPSGSGKTTLLNCLGCIDNPDGGEILLNGESIIFARSDMQARLRRENFGFVFQTYNLIPVLTVYENIELPLKILKRNTDSEIHEMVMSILDDVGLSGLEKRRPLELSGGQQQRVSVARALVKKPKIVFADEPTANLDSATGEAIVDLMKSLNEKDGVTFLFSTHDQLIMKRARRMIHIRDGIISGEEG